MYRLLLAFSVFLAWPAPPAANAQETLQLFNGKDLDHWYTFLKERGRDIDPQKVFTVHDGMIHISGEEWGCITTTDEYENYKLVVEFKWGERCWANRVNAARDSGVLVHSTGADGAYSGIWMYSIECQMIEGGTGDLLVVGNDTDQFYATSPVAEEMQGSSHVFQEDGKPVTITGGRINWWGRAPEWADVKGFRGAKDVEKPVGEWNTLEVVCEGSAITVMLNGVLVNKALDCKPARGKIQIQSEGAELFVRKAELTPLKKKPITTPVPAPKG